MIAKTNEKLANNALVAEQIALGAQREANIASDRDRKRAEKGERHALENKRGTAKAYAQRAEKGERLANQNLYIAQTRLAERSWAEGNVEKTIQILESQRTGSSSMGKAEDLRRARVISTQHFDSQ